MGMGRNPKSKNIEISGYFIKTYEVVTKVTDSDVVVLYDQVEVILILF
jgi:hypothetical protein